LIFSVTFSETFLVLRTERRKGRGVYRDSVRKPEGKSHWGDPGVNGRIIIRLNFRKWDVGLWTGLGWLRIETGGGHL
jgi:hypothetical protein